MPDYALSTLKKQCDVLEHTGITAATSAAAAGGVSTVFEMPLNSNPPTIDVQSLKDKQRLVKVCFVTFVLLVVRERLQVSVADPQLGATVVILFSFDSACLCHMLADLRL